MTRRFEIATLSSGLLRPSAAIATQRAGELAILDFEYARNFSVIEERLTSLAGTLKGPFGVKLSGDETDLFQQVVSILPELVRTVVISARQLAPLAQAVVFLRDNSVKVFSEVTSIEAAREAQTLGVDGLIAKGHEAGGRIADETTFILLQRLRQEISLPVWAHGGLGLHTAPSCIAAGASGIILDAQLALTRESALPEAVRTRISTMDGSETICVGDHLGETYRLYYRPGSAVVKDLQQCENRLAADERSTEQVLTDWRTAIANVAGWSSERDALLLGQDAAFAASLADRYKTVGGVLQAFRHSVAEHCRAAVAVRPLAEGSALAADNGTKYPILQGPMTRVSDVPEFATSVAEGGALPFLALALMRAPEVRTMLADAKARMGSMPWGVGVLGFVPAELRQEQMQVILEYRPPFALIAGGRPDQARAFEDQGIRTYLHVPSPGLLRMFVQQGARRFVFEGRECGGHVGPRTSFVLWNQMVDVLLGAPEVTANPGEFHIVFAAGIHDALSAAMVSVIAAPLAERGVKVGVLIGTAYLFTEEAVSAGAILETFQKQAIECRNTVLLESGPGHSTRCVDTPFANVFAREKRRLMAEGRSSEEIRFALEELNIGRLRIASKGVTRNLRFGEEPGAPKLIEVQQSEQIAEGMYMIGQVAAMRHDVCTVAKLHHDVSVEGTKMLVSIEAPSVPEAAGEPVPAPSDVAVIGVACLLPKASDAATYWENIVNKVDAVTEVPKERWDWQLYFDSDPKAKDKVYSRWGGFIDDTPFDPMQYGMPPATLRSIEPSQLLTLEVVRAALADAGYSDRPFPRDRTSVILGAGGGAADLGLGYSARSFIPVLENLPEFRGKSKEIIERLDGRLPEWTEDSFAGILTNVTAGRVANRFDLGGSNFTVDAACASSLAAVSLAIRELENKTSDMVIVGGVDTMQNPFTYLCFSKTHALSPRGRCRTFDETADGIAISEGIAMLVFKRLEDAERDGDRIYAVIKGVGSSSDGKDRGLTAPRPEGQATALRRAYAKAGLSPATVQLVEAHGTGTVAGDGAEAQALSTVFSQADANRQSCVIGSVKSMIGHTKCTAGAAGLVKAALALHHRVLPPTLGVEKPNSRAKFSESPFFVNTESRPWLAPSGQPRRAGVSAFGFGGTNFHIVLEEYAGDPWARPTTPSRTWPDEVFVWAAPSRPMMAEQVTTWCSALSADVTPNLRDLAFTSWKHASANRGEAQAKQLHLAIVANSLDDLRQKLGSAQDELAQSASPRLHDPRGVYFSEIPLAREGKLAFLFPGQGSQYPQMLQDILLYFPELRGRFEEAVRALDGKLEKPLHTYVFPPSAFSREELRKQQTLLTQTNVAQPAIGAVSIAMFELLAMFGLQPDMAAGHSYGEYAALSAAGVFDRRTLIELSEARGRFIVQGAGEEPGTMAAIEGTEAEIREALKNHEGVQIANLNAPRQGVVAGPRTAVEKVVAELNAQGVMARLIPVACAFHSPLVAPAQQPLTEFLKDVPVGAPEFAVFSNTTAAPYPTDADSIRQRLVDHLVKPVEFVREIEAMYAAGARVFVEVGPRGVLTSLVEQILADKPVAALATNQQGRSGLTQLLHGLGQLAAQGFELNLDRLYQDRSCRELKLTALKTECAPKPLASSTWMVNGARAIPLNEIAKPRYQVLSGAAVSADVMASPVALKGELQTSPPKVAAAAAATFGSQLPAKSVAPTSPANAMSSGSLPVSSHGPAFSNPASTNPNAVSQTALLATGNTSNTVVAHAGVMPVTAGGANIEGLTEVMSQFQQMMTRFLDTQKTVMLAYLGGDAGADVSATSITATNPLAAAIPAVSFAVPPGPPAPVFSPQPPVSATSTVAAAATFRPAPGLETTALAVPVAVSEPKPSSGPNRIELTERLLSIVSDRTGYPREMLDVKLDLEADLGIDSIKRVEILGTFQEAFAAAGVQAQEGLMETLSGVRTLQGIIDLLLQTAEVSAESAPVSAAAAVVQSVANAGPDRQVLTSQLIAIVSERTGYPAEMLNLTLDLEADLGIDSIKRVEILGTFQQTFTDSGIALADGLMEKLSGVRTLQGIIDLVTEAGDVSPARVPVTPNVSTEVQASPAIGLDRSKLTTELVRIVSERTGYPADMLNPQLDLEADLGIDSIKRVEILGTVQQLLADTGVRLEDGFMEKLSGVRTLQGIIDLLAAPATSFPSAPAPVHAAPAPAPVTMPGTTAVEPETPTATEDIRRFTLEVTDKLYTRGTPGLGRHRVALITHAGHAAVEEVAAALSQEGFKVALVAHGSAFSKVSAGSYTADLCDSDSAASLVARVEQDQGKIGAILHLLPLSGGPRLESHDPESWNSVLQLSVKSLFYLSKAAGKSLREAVDDGGAAVIAATAMGGRFLAGLSEDSIALHPEHGGVSGFMKTLAMEWSGVRCRTVDVNPVEDAKALASHIIDELHAGDNLVEVGYSAGRRVTLGVAVSPLDDSQPELQLDGSSVVLLTGGARGITARAAIRLAELYRPTLILVGRSPLPAASESPDTANITSASELKAAVIELLKKQNENVTPAMVKRAYNGVIADREIRANLARIRQSGAAVEYVSVDVRDGDAFGSVIDDVYRTHGRIDGVVHGAGVIEDRLVRDKTPDSFDRVFDTKVNSAFTLTRKLRPETLRFLVFFSSVSGRFGNRGQSDYAAANEVLNKLAVCLDRQWNARVTAINWGPWDTDGMVSDEVRKQFAQRGVSLIVPRTGLQFFEQELRCGLRGMAEVVIGGAAGWAAPEKRVISAGLPLLSKAHLLRNNGHIEYAREFSISHDLYLSDHVIDGQPVLPLAVATEMMAEVVANAWPDMQVAAVRDLRLLNGVVLDHGPKTIRVIANSQTTVSSDAVRVGVEIASATEPKRLHYRAVVELVNRMPQPPAMAVEPLRDGGRPSSLSVRDLYKTWLFHGPLFEGIVNVDSIGPDGVDALLLSSSPEHWFAGGANGNWLIDPLAFDSFLQLLIVWAREHWDMTPLPSGFDCYRRFEGAIPQRVRCQLRMRPNTGGQLLYCDMVLRDPENGRVIATIENMQGACSKVLNRLARREALIATGSNL